MKDKQLRKLLEMTKDPVAFLAFKVKIERTYGKRDVNGPLAVAYPPPKIAEICSQHDCLQKAIPFVKKHGIDGEMISEADIDVFKQISTDHYAAKNILTNL